MSRWTLVIFAVLASALLSGPTRVSAGEIDLRERYELRIIQKAEMKRARELGGYSDPFTAFSNLLRGEVRDSDFQRPFTYEEARDYLYEAPKPKQDRSN